MNVFNNNGCNLPQGGGGSHLMQFVTRRPGSRLLMERLEIPNSQA